MLEIFTTALIVTMAALVYGFRSLKSNKQKAGLKISICQETFSVFLYSKLRNLPANSKILRKNVCSLKRETDLSI